MYLMKTIAIGEQTMPFLEDIEDLHRVDDCTGYVLTNVVGPVIMEDCELYLPKELLKGKYQPDERISQSLTNKLMDIFVSHQLDADRQCLQGMAWFVHQWQLFS